MPYRFNPVGAYYCTFHHGVMNEDDDACDFARLNSWTGDNEEAKCERRRLGYRTVSKRRRRG